jgi:hypothetical protein
MGYWADTADSLCNLLGIERVTAFENLFETAEHFALAYCACYFLCAIRQRLRFGMNRQMSLDTC